MKETPRERIVRCVREEYPGYVVVFDEEVGEIIRFRIQAPDGTIVTNKHPHIEPGKIDGLSDDQLKEIIRSFWA